ncbi:hypothetical protein M0812_03371 [Anaeramoeba flamelloides]|uniref:Uncharacterized protein n=1 Tax=Anaeramoeba flamelloides TaxID=1746091 RepID=A0AAV8AFI5_9EUKA|nr:hypothetical protein M0812_03371 [Anaeramoeba flamelloides]
MSNDLFPDRLDNDDFLSLESLWQNLPPLTEIDLDEINEKENQNKSNPTSPLHSDSRSLLLPSIFPDSTEQEENIFLQKLEPLNVGESRNKTNENLELQKKKDTCEELDNSNSENCIDEKLITIEKQNKFSNMNILENSQISNKELNIDSSLKSVGLESIDLNFDNDLLNEKKKYNFDLIQNKKPKRNKHNLGKKKRNPRKIKQKKKKSKTISKFLGTTPLNRKRSHETSEMITFSNQFLNFSTFKNYFNERHTQKHLSSYSQPSSSDSDSNSNSDFYYDSDSNFNFDSNYLSNKHSKKHKPHFQFPKDYTNDTQNPDSNSDTDSSSFDELILYQFELAKKYQREREWKFSQNKNKIFK